MIGGLIMQTITLKLEDSINDKFLWLLNHFSKNELEILDMTSYQTVTEDKLDW